MGKLAKFASLKKGDPLFVMHNGELCQGTFLEREPATAEDVALYNEVPEGMLRRYSVRVGDPLYIVEFSPAFGLPSQTYKYPRCDVSLNAEGINQRIAAFDPQPFALLRKQKAPVRQQKCGRPIPPVPRPQIPQNVVNMIKLALN